MATKNNKKIDTVKYTQELVGQLLDLIGIDAQAQVFEVEDKKTGEKTIEVSIDSQSETGLLIGAHGSTLNAIQVFLGMAIRQTVGDWVRIVVNIGDWKEKQEEHLLALAEQSASRVKATGDPQRLYNLSASQRRVIHLHFLEDAEISSESEGEGEERHLVLSLKSH